MKKILALIVLITFVMVSGCKKDELQKETLNGTSWAAAYGDYTLWIRFTSDAAFLEFMGDETGNPCSTGVCYGTYSFANNRVVFLTHESTSPFDFAILEGDGSMMNLTYKSGYTRIFAKK